MRAVIQRVRSSKVVVEGRTTGEIEKGLLVLVGVTHADERADIDWLIKKITNLRIFNDEQGKMNLSVKEVGGDILVVSQFTLYADSKKGNRPSYIRSAPPDFSIPMYENFVELLSLNFEGKVATGEFGAMMEVSLLNDGPVTIILDSKEPGW
ncbi:MAG: D-aminoacyl-tRNA deacylase [Bacteroidota bacterium]